jgi:hypothetical protein
MPVPPGITGQSTPLETQLPPAAALPPEPAKRIRRAVTLPALAARRRNAQKSTGPRTAAGKRRAALNSQKRQLCPAWFEPILRREGGDLGDFQRLHRDLIALLQPFDTETRRMVEFLAICWWDKSRRLRQPQLRAPSPAAPAAETRPAANDRAIQEVLKLLYQTNYSQGRRWLARLSHTLGKVPPNAVALRARIEARLRLLGGQPQRHPRKKTLPPDLRAWLMELLEQAPTCDSGRHPSLFPAAAAGEIQSSDAAHPSTGWLRTLWGKVLGARA